MGKQPDWIDLCVAFFWMRETFPISILDHEGALKYALLSGDVPVRGKAPGHWQYQRIEKYISADTEFSITSNALRTISVVGVETVRVLFTVNHSRTTSVNFDRVQVDRRALEAWLNSNIFENSETLTRGYEHGAVAFLTEKLKADRDMTRGDAWEACNREFRALSERGFRFRIWPQARLDAGLERTAPAGRKRTRKP